MKRNLGIVGGFIFIFTFVATLQPVVAHHKKQVLGEATTAAEVVFPPVTAGPGYILPDSPLFFLDQLSQAVRVNIAPDSKARIAAHKQIAGERMAELRIMFSKNNAVGINTALFGLNNEMRQAAEALTQAVAEGKNVETEAKDLNDTIKMQRSTLDQLVDQSDGSLQLQLKATRKGLQEAKVEVEDSLPEDELWKEIDETLSVNVSENIEEAGSLAKKLQADLDRLNLMASEAASRSLQRRNQALQEAIDLKNKELVEVQKIMLADEKAKQDKLLSAQKAVNTEATKALGSTIQAVENLQKAQEAVADIKGQ